jgi:hypothetical protein
MFRFFALVGFAVLAAATVGVNSTYRRSARNAPGNVKQPQPTANRLASSITASGSAYHAPFSVN